YMPDHVKHDYDLIDRMITPDDAPQHIYSNVVGGKNFVNDRNPGNVLYKGRLSQVWSAAFHDPDFKPGAAVNFMEDARMERLRNDALNAVGSQYADRRPTADELRAFIARTRYNINF